MEAKIIINLKKFFSIRIYTKGKDKDKQMKIVSDREFAQILREEPKRVSITPINNFCWERPLLLDGEKFLTAFTEIARAQYTGAYVLMESYNEIRDMLCARFKVFSHSCHIFEFSATGALDCIRKGASLTIFFRFTIYGKRIIRTHEYIKPHVGHHESVSPNRPPCTDICEAYCRNVLGIKEAPEMGESPLYFPSRGKEDPDTYHN